MNLKYYLRGLGIGVVVTAVIMSITLGGRKETLSNAEIRERAKELGMVEPAKVLTELEEEPAEKDSVEKDLTEKDSAENEPEQAVSLASPEAKATEAPSAEPLASPEAAATEAPSASPEAKATEAPSASPSAAPSAEPSPSTSPAAQETPPPSGEGAGDTDIIIVVRPGESSYTICKKLEDAGIVSSASAFDSYLCSKGYDTKLRTGSFEVPADAEPEEIARILVPGS